LFIVALAILTKIIKFCLTQPFLLSFDSYHSLSFGGGYFITPTCTNIVQRFYGANGRISLFIIGVGDAPRRHSGKSASLFVCEATLSFLSS
jgi:hypothetical protein